MEVKIQIQGAERLESLLRKLPMEGPKIVRAAASKSLKKMSAAMRSAIPAAITKGHDTASIRQAVGDRVRTKSEVITVAKAGVGVGMMTDESREVVTSKLKKTAARHAHLYVMGTQDRWTGERSWRVKGGRRKKPTGKPRMFRGRMDPRKYMPRQMSEVIASNATAVGQVFVDEVTKRVTERVNGL